MVFHVKQYVLMRLLSNCRVRAPWMDTIRLHAMHPQDLHLVRLDLFVEDAGGNVDGIGMMHTIEECYDTVHVDSPGAVLVSLHELGNVVRHHAPDQYVTLALYEKGEERVMVSIGNGHPKYVARIDASTLRTLPDAE